jgi:hypothetical protein
MSSVTEEEKAAPTNHAVFHAQARGVGAVDAYAPDNDQQRFYQKGDVVLFFG